MAPERANNIRSPARAVPGVMVFHEKLQEENPLRTIIKDSHYNPNEFAALSGNLNEIEMPRGLVLARELTGGGHLRLRAQGQWLGINGTSGDLLLRLYTSTSNDPNVALGSASLVLTHTVPLADPGQPTTIGGQLLWELQISARGNADYTSSQDWYSKIIYQRWSHGTPDVPDTLHTHEDGGSITIDFRANDQILIPTMQKVVGVGAFQNSRFNIFAFDGWVHHGQSGAA